jgi:hypothetical protein
VRELFVSTHCNLARLTGKVLPAKSLKFADGLQSRQRALTLLLCYRITLTPRKPRHIVAHLTERVTLRGSSPDASTSRWSLVAQYRLANLKLRTDSRWARHVRAASSSKEQRCKQTSACVCAGSASRYANLSLSELNLAAIMSADHEDIRMEIDTSHQIARQIDMSACISPPFQQEHLANATLDPSAIGRCISRAASQAELATSLVRGR